MGLKLPSEQLALYQQIDLILWQDWNPIGISALIEARDEYYRYLPPVFHLVMSHADSTAIADYLYSIEVEQMGLVGDRLNCDRVAQKIIVAKTNLGL